MYLYKAKKLPTDMNVSASDLYLINNYLEFKDYKTKKPEYTDFTLTDWCGTEEDEVNLKLVDLYQSEFKTTYGSWDKLKTHPYKSILTMIQDWRKANAIHNWFVINTQNEIDECQPSFVSKEQFEDLLDIINTILKHKDNQSLLEKYAKDLLPTTKGFFFGSYEYDEWYVSDLEDTQKFITNLLSEPDFDQYYYIYIASW